MKAPNIKTTQAVSPMIYAYTTPEIKRHDGWTKIGYTEQDVETRIKQQTHTADIKFHVEWKGNAVYDDGSGETFTDKDFHVYMRKKGVEQEPGKDNEWFHVTGLESRSMFFDFRANRGILEITDTVRDYKLRAEQERAVLQTIAYKNRTENGEFLWNAKPRFGKTLSVYDFCIKTEAKTVLIVTNRPAIANSWYEDYMKFVGTERGYFFISEVDALKGKPGVLTRKEYFDVMFGKDDEEPMGCIEFVSLQDMKGSKYFSANGIDKLREVADITWDVLVIDEAHEGVDTYKTDVAFDRIKRDFTLHLSGTPFKALANNKFKDDAIFNWTYADEQTMKNNWDTSSEEENPYAPLPKLNLYTYQMSEIVRDELSQGIEIEGETEEYAFDLNEFFSTNNAGRFVHDSSVDKFLDALTTQKKFPFSTEELRGELNHTFWMLDRVDSAKAMATKLKNHPVFKDYEIVLAAGDGKIENDDEIKKSYDKVVSAIEKSEKTITLSVGQLTTGITIPEWTGVLMLSNIKSPALYMQAAFRSQNPCLFKKGTKFARKENAYVFDFDPARTLTIFEEFANDLSVKTSSGKGDLETRKANIKTLLNFFPVIGEDENGELVELDAEKVLTIPRKIRSVEVVKRGFMSNFLFQNITGIFGAPQSVIDIINQFTPTDEPKKTKTDLPTEIAEEWPINDEGDIELSEEIVIGKTQDVFGNKIYGSLEAIPEILTGIKSESDDKAAISKLKETIHEITTKDIIEIAKEEYGDSIRSADQRRLENSLKDKADTVIDKTIENFNIEKNIIEEEKNKALQNRFETGQSTEDINIIFDVKKTKIAEKMQKELNEVVEKFVEESQVKVIETVETKIKEREKASYEDAIRDHLRGFSRTIPSFLMAYGDDTVTLGNFDKIIPAEVFKAVTSITLEQFRFLRDGGDYIDEETGETSHFDGNLFEPVVFDDSVKEFLSLKERLANYFDESATEDIFDYIPSQKTNQIYTPKKIVKKMVDMLEEENLGCFDDPDKTFIDLYMKSGLYVTEIVKRLFQSENMKKLFPSETERLNHIFEKQVYGLAPTEIIYRIALSYVLGFSKEITIAKHNLRQCDALPYAKEKNLEQLLDKLYKE